ncbi:endonuclease/exonuclease/phosphatase family protein [Streptomyces parvulus]|uniref:endonuclease/exonuclease/phosphatase family protein n=1 Tax=Streptomyces parvulus TaxID=146923 RepID=UPI0033C67597
MTYDADASTRPTNGERGRPTPRTDTATPADTAPTPATAPPPATPPVRRVIRALSRPGPWRRGRVLAVLAVLLGLLLPLHGLITDRGGLGSLVETFLPWLGLGVPVLQGAALLRRSATAVVALLVPSVAWASLFGGMLADKSRAGGSDLTVVTHNVGAANPDPAGTARDLVASGADLLALEELTEQDRSVYERELAAAYPHHTVQGTVGLWSRLPLSGVAPVDTMMDYGPLAATKPDAAGLAANRALRATVTTAQGPLAVYVAHLGSVRLMPRGGFWTDSRDRNAQALADALAAEENERMLLLGDLNATLDDRAVGGITARLDSAQEQAGAGFGFTYPARFPVVRIDQILVGGVRTDRAWSLPATGSDHLPVAAGISW